MTETVTEDHAEFREGESYIKVARIENKNGPECWIYDIEGEGAGAVRLMLKARQQAKEWGFEDVFAPVCNPELAMTMRSHGWDLEYVILKGKT